MKSFTTLLTLVTVITSAAFALPYKGQAPLGAHPGFNIDLNEQRLVELEGQQRVWMTELEKVWSISVPS
jgi:leucyl aminopeptidase